MTITPDEIISFWQDAGPDKWYAVDPAFDAEIRERFFDFWVDAKNGEYDDWTGFPEPSLAYIIALDQFPRNMFRGQADAFATDAKAKCAAKRALYNKLDMHVEPPMRQFFYLPLMHSEVLADQDTSVRMAHLRLNGNTLHARAHREVIRKFGRFPFRNKALGRGMTAREQAYLDAGGYGSTVQAIG